MECCICDRVTDPKKETFLELAFSAQSNLGEKPTKSSLFFCRNCMKAATMMATAQTIYFNQIRGMVRQGMTFEPGNKPMFRTPEIDFGKEVEAIVALIEGKLR